jgi:hypothetical protein
MRPALLSSPRTRGPMFYWIPAYAGMTEPS